MDQHPVLRPRPTLADIQAYIAATVKFRGFHGSIQDDFVMLTEEIGELAKSLRKMHGVKLATDSAATELEHEAADALWMLVCVCNQLGVDLEQALRSKEEKNKLRTWN